MLKQIFKKIIVFVITLEARAVLWKHKPRIIAVTGSVGKTSAKDAIEAVLKKGFGVRKNRKSYNSEIGVPLVILGCESGWLNPLLWALNILKGLKTLLKNDYPQWLILEMGVERPKDMERLVSWIRPHIAVITALANIPSHIEFFTSLEALVHEKAKILKNLKTENTAILNSDDVIVCNLKNQTKAKVVTYGFEEGADLIASNYRITNEGITFKVDCEGSIIPVRLLNVFGKHHVYPALVAMAVGRALGLNFVDMSDSLRSYESPPGRMKIIKGVKNSMILDDTYNSSPIALRAALETLGEVEAKRKLAILGDMLELGKYTIEAHKAMAEYVVRAGVEIVFIVGPRAKFIAESLREKNFSAKEGGNIFEFSNSEQAKRKLEEIIKEGDLILVKGSQSMRMEKIVEEIMAEPKKKEQLLVRQEKVWKHK